MDEQQITEMLALYAQTTLSSVAIGNLYDRDHTTVLYHVKRHNIVRGVCTTISVELSTELPVSRPRTQRKPTPEVKDYAYYLRLEEQRKAARHSKSFPAQLCISEKKRKVSSDIIDIGVEVIL